MTMAENIVGILSPYVGPSAADTCVRGTALSRGKTADSLSADDLPALENHVRRLLGPVVPASTLESIVSEIKGV